MENQVAKVEAGLPAMAGASEELKARMLEVRENLESVENFKLPKAKMTAGGIELIEGEEPLLELQAVILHAQKTNIYYAKPYNPSATPEPPTCVSYDGISPADLKHEGYAKQHATCAGCPKAEFGTNVMGKGKACRNMKPLYLLLSEEAIMPRQFVVTPTSLKAVEKYLMDLTERGVSFRKALTSIKLFKENPRDTYYKLKFSLLKRLDEQRSKDVEFLRNQWLPVMGKQIIEQAEFSSESAETNPVSTSGEF